MAPVYKESVQNGLPIVRFDRALSQGLQTSSYTLTSVPVTLVTAIHPTDPNGGAYQYYFSSYYYYDTTKQIYGLTNANDLRVYAGLNLIDGVLAPEFQIISFVIDGANSLLRINGNQVASGDAGTNFMGQYFRVGDPQTISREGSMDLGEFLLYYKGLTTAELEEAETYLANKWSVSI